jgi:predicted SAM-dependent methyltransferase
MSRNDSTNAPYTNKSRLGGEGLDDGQDVTLFRTPYDLDDLFDIAMGRPRVDFEELQMSPFPGRGKRLHFGGGAKRLTGYEERDWPEWDAEATNMGGQLLPWPDEPGSVSEIVCIHTLDHLSSRAVQHWLREADQALEIGGHVNIVVPHFMSTLAHECIEHKTQYGLKTFRNILSEINDASVDYPEGRGPWGMRVGFNMVMGLEERNLVLVTQLVKVS